MRAAIVYESMFGNTRTIAEAVALGLAIHDVDVELAEVGQARPGLADDLDLLVVGGPTHALSMSRRETRASAAEQADAPLVSNGIGLREWLAELPPGNGRMAAAFDTHVDKRIPGSASRSARKRLRRRGYRPIAPAESFYVSDMQGPLVDGEEARARGWGTRLATAMGATGARGKPDTPAVSG
jgi:hypothetical protein